MSSPTVTAMEDAVIVEEIKQLLERLIIPRLDVIAKQLEGLRKQSDSMESGMREFRRIRRSLGWSEPGYEARLLLQSAGIRKPASIAGCSLALTSISASHDSIMGKKQDSLRLLLKRCGTVADRPTLPFPKIEDIR